jgi:hypothetical protein
VASRDGSAPNESTQGVTQGVSTVVLVVRDGTSPRRSVEIMRWVRTLVPAALVLVLSAPISLGASDGVITVNVDEVDAGPLAVAAALARPRGHD